MIIHNILLKKVLTLFMVLSLLIVLLFAKATEAQQDTENKPIIQAGNLSDLTLKNLSPDRIKALMQKIEAKEMDEEIRIKVLNLYKETLEQIEQIETWSNRIKKLEQTNQQAPAELEQIKVRIQKTKLQKPEPVVEINDKATLEAMMQKLHEAEADLNTKKQAANKVEDSIKHWSDRRAALPKDLLNTNVLLEQVTEEMNKSTAADIDPILFEATKTLLSARQKAIKLEVSTYNEELRLYDVTSKLLAARLEEARLKVAQVEAVVSALEKAVSEKRLAETKQQKQEVAMQLSLVPEPLRELSEKNDKLAQEHRELVAKIDAATLKNKNIEKKIKELKEQMNVLQTKVDAVGMGAYIGPLLLWHAKQLPEAADSRRDIRKLKDTITSVQLRLFDLRGQYTKLSNLDNFITTFLTTLEKKQPDIDRPVMEPIVREIFNTRLQSIESLRRDYTDYWNDLLALNIAENRLLKRIVTFKELIGKHILWIPNVKPLHQTEFPKQLTQQPGTWRDIGDALSVDIANHLFSYLFILLLPLIRLVFYRPIRDWQQKIKKQISHTNTDSFRLTLGTLGLDLFLSLIAPAVLWYLGGRIAWSAPTGDGQVYGFAQALSQGLRQATIPLFIFTFMRYLCRQGGVAEAHFKWDAHAVSILHRNALWLMVIGTPMVFLLHFSRNHPDELWMGSVGRIALMIAAVVLSYFFHFLLHPKRGVIAYIRGQTTAGPSLYPMFFGYLTAVSVPIVLVIISFAGYQYTALTLGTHIARTIYVLLALFVFRAAILRAVFASQQKPAMKQTKQQLAVAKKFMRDQTERLLRWFMIFGIITGLWIIWHDIVPAFSFVKEVELWSYPVEVADVIEEKGDAPSKVQVQTKVVPVYLLDVIFALILAGLTIVLATNGPNVIETIVLMRLPIDSGARFAIATILRYTIVVTGLILSFNIIGIGWGQVQWLAAAVTVGLGFGLQEIVANFVSGLIILFERNVRVGDVVTVGNIDGRVMRIKMRATTIMDWNQRELIVPNKQFITTDFINWTLSDPVTRVDISIGIAYGSDTHLARDLLMKVARENTYVLKEPEPYVIFKCFGESSLDFELRVYIPERSLWPKMTDTIHMAIDSEFRQAGIEIAFPQQDIHVRSVEEGLRDIEKRPG